MIGYIHSIESFGAVDGPGVRLVVFMQGCPMRCMYCHNPDTWEMQKQTPITVDEVLKKYERNESFYRNGGITLTGGEPMMQLPFITELFTSAKERNIHTCLDTSGVCFQPDNDLYLDNLLKLLSVTDLIMLDIKHIDDEKHRQITGHSNANILSFADYLNKREFPIWIRHVVVPGLTDDEESLCKLGRFLSSLNNIKALDVLPYHTMGKTKYDQLCIPYPLGDTPAMDFEDCVHKKQIILNAMNASNIKP